MNSLKQQLELYLRCQPIYLYCIIKNEKKNVEGTKNI